MTYGRTLLHKAARKGNVDEVRRLLATIKVSAVDDDGSTALHDAVLGGDDMKAAEVSLPRPIYAASRCPYVGLYSILSSCCRLFHPDPDM